MINEQIEIVQEDKKNELLMMKTYIEKVEKGKKKKTYRPLFSEKQKENIKSIEKIVDKEMERQEKERKRQEEEIRKKEEEERRKRKGWLCNAYGCLHPDGPCGCADPSQGGHWVT